jgi:cytochrome c oxidase subunit 2
MDSQDSSSIFPWPVAASAHAVSTDWLTLAFLAVIAAVVVPVCALLLYFTIKYRRGAPAERAGAASGQVGLELAWMVIPFLLMLVFFVWAALLYDDLHDVPPNALEIAVVANQWMWKFQHPSGAREIDDLHVPIGRPVLLTMISQDAIHSLFVPVLRLKQDVLPGRYTYEWFEITKPGRYHLFCTQFCGTDHSAMAGEVIALQPGDYQAWLEKGTTTDGLAQSGAELFRRYGCSGCHLGSPTVHAPRLEGLFGSPVPLADGTIVTADENYIRDSILLPDKQVAAGYSPIMPSFKGTIAEEDIQKLVAYIKSIGGARNASETGDRP